MMIHSVDSLCSFATVCDHSSRIPAQSVDDKQTLIHLPATGWGRVDRYVFFVVCWALA